MAFWVPPEAGKLKDGLQPVSPATVTFRLPAADVNVNVVGVTPVGEDGHGSTMMGMFRPPMVTVPDCPALPERTVTLTRPSSDTLDGVVAIQARSSLTGQLQPAGPVTDRLSVPPAGGNLNDDGLTLVGDVGHGTTMTGTSVPPIATVPDRSGGPGVTLTCTVPPADTVEGVAVIQAWSSLTDQLQPAGPVTDRLSVPPAAGNVNDDGETVVGAAGQPEACDTETELPPMATVPSRAPPGFSPAWIRTEPPPDTLDGVGVSHPWSALTDQLQSLRPVTLTYRTLVAAGKLVDVGDTRSGEDGQGPGGCCVTVNVAPATVRVPLRLDVPVFACAV